MYSDVERYISLVGKLNYLTNTRPDLSFAVQQLNQFLQEPRVPHFKAVMHVLKYLKGSTDAGIFIDNKKDFITSAYSDSDWGSCMDTRRSVTGYFVFLGGSLVSWKSRKQSIVSLSSAEAEYRALSKVSADLVWIKRLLLELDVAVSCPIVLHTDSLAALQLAKNPVFHERTKHIELDCHFIREKIIDGLIVLKHVSSSE